MASRQDFKGSAIVVAIALVVGLVVGALIELVIEATVASPGDIGGLAAIALPAAAGLVAVVVTLDAGLRKLRRPNAKAGW